MTAFPLTTLASCLALIICFAVSIVAGRARYAFGVEAPAVTGHVEFEKRHRVHMNTLEQIVLFLPALWMALPIFGDRNAALIGLVWCIGRVIYAAAYVRDPKSRSLGFGLTVIPTLVLVVAAIVGALRTISG